MKDKLQNIQNHMEQCCKMAQRDVSNVTLIAVSKTQPICAIEEAYHLGCRHFGENRVQELLEKYDALPKDITWHMIGHLQRNKVKYIIDKVSYIHSVDSYELAVEIHRQAVLKQVDSIAILIEVNIAKESTKFGVLPEEVLLLVQKIQMLERISVVGLMTVAPYVEDEMENNQYFCGLSQLLVDINGKNIDNSSMYELSMGMSNDYKTAIINGATMIRIGSDLFGIRS